MTKLSLLVVSFALVGLGGSASADKQTAAPTPTAPAQPYVAPTPVEVEMPASDVTKWMSFFDKLVVVVVAAEGSCDKLATDVSKVIDDNKSAITLARNAKQNNMKLPPTAQTRMVEGVKKMVPAMQKCGQDPKVRTAFSKLDLNRKG